MNMEFTLTTEEIQDIVLALICNDSSVLKKKPEVVHRLTDTFASMNKLCKERNNYTVSITVTD